MNRTNKDLLTPEDNDIMSLAELSVLVSDMNREKILKKHKYAISHMTNGNWCTHVVTSKGVKKTITRSTKKGIEDAIVDFYNDEEMNPVFGKVFEMWIEEKHEYAEISESSYTRYKNDFKRFFPFDSDFYHLKIGNIDDRILERYIKLRIRDLKLTRKAYNAMRTLIMGTFKYAKRERMTDFSISTFFKDMEIPKRMFVQKQQVLDEEQVFTVNEIHKLIDYLWQNKTIRNLGIILMFETGLRVGELTALRRSNIMKDAIEVTSTEISYDNEDGKRIFTVQDVPKTVNGHRLVYLTDNAQKVIREILKINPFGEFLFMDKGLRIRSKSMNYHIKKACREVGISERSTHKIRKTYASTLIRNNVDERLVMKLMGHSDIATTKKYYYFNTAERDEARDEVRRAITY